MQITLQRRRLLGSLVAAAISGHLTQAAFASTESTVLGNYADAVSRTQSVIALAAKHRSAGQRFNALHPEVTAAVDGLLNFLLDSFPGEVDASAIKQMLMQPKSSMPNLSDMELERLSADLVPFAIVRELVRRHEVAFDATCMGYQRFVQRYASAILET